MSNNSNESQGLNPAWKPLLDALPEPLHAVVTPHLSAWDKGVQEKLQEVRSEYEPYKGLLDAKVDPQIISNSLYLYEKFSNNPEEVIAEAIKAYELPYVDSNSIQTPNEDEDLDMTDYSEDITKHPQIQEIAQQVQKMQSTLSEREQADLNAQAVKQHEQWLEEMQKPDKYGNFDTTYVTALMSQGVDGEQAIKKYQELVANVTGQQVQQTQTSETPPVVMGGNGTTGSGLPNDSINFNNMTKNDFNDSVVAMLEAQQQQNNQG